jgi:hypothetical protein
MNEIKKEIEYVNSENRKLEQEFESKISENNSKLSDYGQIILSIKNIYSSELINSNPLPSLNQDDSTDTSDQLI